MKGEYIKPVTDICNFFKVLPEDIFPDEMYNIKESKLSITVPLSTLKLEQKEKLFYIQDYENQILESDIVEDIKSMLKTIPEREAQIVRLRYGIDCKEKSLQEIGLQYNITRERVRQISLKALRRLRHPKRLSKRLKENADSYYGNLSINMNTKAI